MALNANQRRVAMKFYDELKAEMETIQQQMAEVKKNKQTHLRKLRSFAKSLALQLECLRLHQTSSS